MPLSDRRKPGVENENREHKRQIGSAPAYGQVKPHAEIRVGNSNDDGDEPYEYKSDYHVQCIAAGAIGDRRGWPIRV